MTASPEAHPAEISHSSFYDNSYICGWLLVSTGKNNKESQPGLQRGGRLIKITITMFVLYAGKLGTFENWSLNTVEMNNYN